MKNHKKISIECYEDFCCWYVNAQIETDEENKIYDNKITIERKVEPEYFNKVENFIKKIIKDWIKVEEERVKDEVGK